MVQDFLANEFFESPCFRQTPSIPGGNWWNEAEEAGESSGAESKSKEVSKSKRMKMERREIWNDSEKNGTRKKKVEESQKKKKKLKKKREGGGERRRYRVPVWCGPPKSLIALRGLFPLSMRGEIFACITSPAGSIWFGGLHLGCFCVLVLILVFYFSCESRGINVWEICAALRLDDAITMDPLSPRIPD